MEYFMTDLLDSIRKSLDSENWYAALFVALALPDICGCVEKPLQKSGVRYKWWFNKYMTKYTENIRVPLSGDECWMLRCSILHQFTDTIDMEKTTRKLGRFELIAVNLQNWSVNTNSTMGESLTVQLDIIEFCTDLCNAVEEWKHDCESSQDLMSRINHTMIINDVKKTGRINIDGFPLIQISDE